MGYTGAPWYFEFIIVGIAVSTLGLMRLFRPFWRVRAETRAAIDGSTNKANLRELENAERRCGNFNNAVQAYFDD